MPIGYSNQPGGALDRAYRWLSRVTSRHAGGADQLPSQQALLGFRRAQRLAYDSVVHVATLLAPGMTEIEAAKLLADDLKSRGTERFLHRPFAWFGEHARFDGYATYGDYHPSERRLREGEAAILDVSPIVDGYIADVGYATCIGASAGLEAAQTFLLELRDLIPRLFASPMTPAAIWDEINRRIAAAGYDNIHAKYPHCVLGHRVFKVKARTGKSLRVGTSSFGWFSLETNMKFLGLGLSAALTPEHVGKKLGLWAIEPHIGWHDGGAKFEEILVVEPTRAYWLDDKVPHVLAARQGECHGGA
ncbi:MAG: M24 family metallopeptidase [Pseudomonadota bacterium]